MQLDRSSGDCQSQADAAAIAVTVNLDVKEWFEQIFEAILGNARPVVANLDHCATIGLFQRGLDS